VKELTTGPIRRFHVEFFNKKKQLDLLGSYTFKKQFAQNVPIDLRKAKRFIKKLIIERKIVMKEEKDYSFFVVRYGERGLLFERKDLWKK